MTTTRALPAVFSTLFVALLAPGARADLDRPPAILEPRQVGNTVHLLWAPGGDADGTLNGDVVSYELQRKGLGPTSWTTIFTGDEHAMTYVDSVDDSATWTSHKGDAVNYRVESDTTTSDKTLSAPVGFVPSLPLWLEEARDGQARLAWVASVPRVTGATHLGYRVQKYVSGSWTDLTGYISELSYIDPNTTTGVSRYRVKSVYQKPTGGTDTLTSNEPEIEIQTLCDGQVADPAIPPLTVIEIDDRDDDLDYDGDDIANALEECADKEYELLDGLGDDDGVCENGETCVIGGCVLSALPVTYDDVAIAITDNANSCFTYSNPNHCLVMDLPAGLVIEGQGSETVFRSPVWNPPYKPAAILEVRRRDFPVTLRNLALDGRKHDQVYPDNGSAATWHHYGFRTWNQFAIREIIGDGLGHDNPQNVACNAEACTENPAGGHDGDGRCDAGENCVENNAAPGGNDDGVCDTDLWPNAQGCYTVITSDDGCIHNVEVRNVLSTGVAILDARRWIVEDSEFHDMGCVNRGYGFDCPNFESAPDDGGGIAGWKVPGYGMDIGVFTSDFKVRRNEFYRTAKYGLSFKNGDATSCHGLLTGHEVAYNDLHDLGYLGIFHYGTAGARVHHNSIDGTTTFDEPQSANGQFNSFGMSLGGLCSDDNEFTDNVIRNVAGLAISWDGVSETVECDGSGCTPVTAVGNTIRDTTIDGTCLEKDTAPGATSVYLNGSIHLHNSAGGSLSLIDNTLTNSQCRFVISAYGPNPGIEPLDARISGGSYESGPNAATVAEAESNFYCGALHAHGSNRKIVVGDDTSIANASDEIPKACVGYGATLVIDDVPDDPFADGLYTNPEDVGGAGGPVTIVECSQTSHPDCD